MIADPSDNLHPYTIQLQLEGVVSYFEYSLHISAEFEGKDIPHLELTALSPACDPYDEDYATQEESHLNFRENLISVTRSDGPFCIPEVGTRLTDAFQEEEPHWKPSQVSLRYNTSDVTE